MVIHLYGGARLKLETTSGPVEIVAHGQPLPVFTEAGERRTEHFEGFVVIDAAGHGGYGGGGGIDPAAEEGV